MSKTRVPRIPRFRVADAGLQRFIDAVTEAFEVREGRRGDRLDGNVTWRDLRDAGFGRDRKLVTPGGAPLEPDPGSGGGLPEMAIPPAPEGVSAAGAVQNILISWAEPPYANHAHTEVWRAAVDDLGQAVKIGDASAFMYADAVGPGVGYFYWVRFVSTSGVAGPYNAVAGTYAETGIDVPYILDALTNEITESQLFQDLNARIDLIDEPGTGLVSQINQLSTEVDGNTAAIETKAETSAVTDLEGQVTAIQAQWMIKTDVNGHVAGIGLMNDGATSAFGVLADQFWIAHTGSGDDLLPFVVDGGKVYMDVAAIKDGTITNAKIGNAAIDNAKIADAAIMFAKIVKGDIFDLTVGNEIKSSNFVAGSTGWRVLKGGSAEFSGVTVRGHVVANTGSIADAVSIGGGGKSVSQVLSEVDGASASITDWTRPGSTLINGNKIFTGDAYVDTLQIKGQAVTFAQAANFADLTTGSAGTWTIGSIGFTCTGAPVFIQFGSSTLLGPKITASEQSGSTKFYLREGSSTGTILRVFTANSFKSTDDPLERDKFVGVSSARQRSPGSGWIRYYLTAEVTYGGSSSTLISAPWMIVQEIKR